MKWTNRNDTERERISITIRARITCQYWMWLSPALPLSPPLLTAKLLAPNIIFSTSFSLHYSFIWSPFPLSVYPLLISRLTLPSLIFPLLPSFFILSLLIFPLSCDWNISITTANEGQFTCERFRIAYTMVPIDQTPPLLWSGCIQRKGNVKKSLVILVMVSSYTRSRGDLWWQI